MALTSLELSDLRGWVGDEPTDAELDTLYDLHRSVEKVAYVVLSRRMASMAADPLRFTVDGDVTEDYTENIKILAAQIQKLAPMVDAGGTTPTGRLLRPSRR